MQNSRLYLFTGTFLFFEYVRPQDLIPALGILRPALLLIILMAITVLKNHRFVKKNISKQINHIFFFIVVLWLLVPFARNGHYAFETAKSMAIYLLFIISFVLCFNTKDKLKRGVVLAIIFMTFQACYAIIHGGRGTGGQFGDENDLSLFVNTWLPFCYIFLLQEKRILLKLVYGSCLLAGIGANVVSFSRGGFLGMIAMILVIWMVSPGKIKSIIRASLVIFVVCIFAKDDYWKEMSSSTDSDSGTARVRIESWKAGWRMFLANPLGVGANNFQVRFPEYQSTYHKRNMWGRVAHSLWFTLLPELGILGTLIFGLLLKKNLVDINYIRKYSKKLSSSDKLFYEGMSIAFFGSFAGFFVSASFLSVLYYSHYWFITAFIIATSKVFLMTLNTRHIENVEGRKDAITCVVH
jgi:hypothetical protein